MNRSVFVAILGIVLSIALGAPNLGHSNSIVMAQEKPSTVEVKIDNFSFGPTTLTIPVGTTVTWINRDDIPHTVVSTDDPKASPKCSTPMKSSLSPLPNPGRMHISVRSIRR